MEIQFLGTGAGIPSKFRNVSSLALRLHDELNEVWLFDCEKQHNIKYLTHLFALKKSLISLLRICMVIIYLDFQDY